MEQKQRLFIYDRKEMGVLLLLGVMVAIFAFTLGVHLGKRVGPKVGAGAPLDAPTVATVPDKVPERPEINEQSKGAQQAVDESLNQALHDEVGRTGIKLDAQRQVELPNKARSENGGAMTDGGGTAPDALAEIAAAQREAPDGKFTLQIGSFPGVSEAKDQVDAMEALGLKPFLRAAEVKGKGKWFRVFLGGFASKDDAERAGKRFQSQHVIESFIVAKNE